MTTITIVTQWEGRSWEGRVEGITLDNVFRYFNRVEESDAERLEGIGYELQSLTGGDLVRLDATWYFVASVGFEQIGNRQANLIWSRMEEAARKGERAPMQLGRDEDGAMRFLTWRGEERLPEYGATSILRTAEQVTRDAQEYLATARRS